jgi:putative chitinase
MANEQFKVSNAGGMWLRTEPVVSEATKKILLAKGQIVTKLSDSDNPNWWKISVNVNGADQEGFSNKNLMVPVNGSADSDLMARTLAALAHVAPDARDTYMDAVRNGTALFQEHGITTGLRMAHFLAQAMAETGAFTVLRESMNYRVPRMLEIFGVGHHSAKITAAEAPQFAHNEHALAERVYGAGNPGKAAELGNTQPGDGFRYRGNGVLQTTGREAHRKMGQKCGLDFENNPDLVTMTEHALKPALQEWSDGNLNHFADLNDIRTITLRINGGLNGFAERKAFFARLKPLLT